MRAWKVLLVLWCLTLPVQAQKRINPVQVTSNTNAVLGLLKGEVELYGDFFGSPQFQRGLLSLAQQKSIQVKLLTNPAYAPNTKPLGVIGAEIKTVPARFLNGMILIRNHAVIYPQRSGGYQVIQNKDLVYVIQNEMEKYWNAAKAYTIR